MTTWTAKVAGVRPIVVARSRRQRFERATVDLALRRVRSLSSASSEYLAFDESCAACAAAIVEFASTLGERAMGSELRPLAAPRTWNRTFTRQTFP